MIRIVYNFQPAEYQVCLIKLLIVERKKKGLSFSFKTRLQIIFNSKHQVFFSFLLVLDKTPRERKQLI